MKHLQITFAGSGELGIPTLHALLAAGVEVKQVITQPDRPAGRGRTLTPTPIAQAATGAGLSVLRTPDVNAERLTLYDALVVIAFGQKISDEVVHGPRLGSINLHASRLPRYRGAGPINWAIIRGDAITGNSVIRLARRMDAGAILAQSSIPIDPLETAGELHDRLALDGAPLMLAVLDSLWGGTAIETPQDESQATGAPKLSRTLARLDFQLPAVDLARWVRGLYPWPGCRVRLIDDSGAELARLRLVRARPGSTDAPGAAPGQLLPDGSVQTGHGAMQIVEVQPDGRTAMTLADYQRGHRWAPGMRLEAIE